MNIQINNFKILNEGEDILIDVEVNSTNVITDILLWYKDDYKDYNKAISLQEFLTTSNHEELVLSHTDLNRSKFDNIMFIEVYSDYVSDCGTSATLAVTYDLSEFYDCYIRYILDSKITSCDNNVFKENNKDELFFIIILFNTIDDLLSAELYDEVIYMINKLEILCNSKKCNDCNKVKTCKTCKNFIQP